ncbi:hypothetical protein [Sphingomonas sp. PB4P5]|uniref:hypothetical protein n=1 Tax=Parasphingomonas puruogangriensis TaxID=3096155 RepID=UPI002FC7C8F5
MSMRISDADTRPFLLVLVCLLAACGEQKTDHATLAKYEAERSAAQGDDGRLMCAQGQGAFAPTCTVERQTGPDGLVLTLRHADGAFRRLLVTKDGRGVVAADGAEQAKVSVLPGNQIEVALGGSRYRLPATVKGGTPAS